MAYAVVSDVADTLGRPIINPSEITQVTVWLRRVESRIRGRIPTLAILAGNVTYLQTLVDIEADVVTRRVKNPDGKQNEKIDDYSYGLNDVAATSDLWLTEQEWAQLIPLMTTLPGAYTVDLGTPHGWPA